MSSATLICDVVPLSNEMHCDICAELSGTLLPDYAQMSREVQPRAK